MNRLDKFKAEHGVLFNIGRRIDIVLNGLLHWDFGHTLSAYYGRRNPNCRLCRFLNRFEPWHCVRSAWAEGLINTQRAKDLTNGEVP